MNYQLECAIWEFTLACNLRCSHCGSAAGDPRPDELTTNECFKLCEDLAELGCPEVAIMGGEPFLRDDWFSVGQCVKDLGMNLNFVSNGILIEQNIAKLARLKPSVIGISLDGMKESHENVRGNGTWEKTIKALELLRENGIQTTIITAVSKNNINDLERIKDFILKKGINWQIQLAIPFGNFKEEQMLSKEEFYKSAEFIIKVRKENPFEDLPVVGAHCYGYFSEIFPNSNWEGCTAGFSSVGITSNGGVVGCLSMGNNRLIEGNIRDESFIEIWENSDNFAYNRKFKKEDLGPNCKNCKYRIECKGGCNSVSYALTEKFHNDPFCFYKIEKNL